MSRARVRDALAVAGALGLALPGAAQEPPSFPTISELVVLDLVARDRNGRLVEDLRADDIKVFEDGLPCLVRSFRLVRAGSAPGSSAVRDAPSGLAPSGATAGATPTAAEMRANVVLLVFDRLSPENADAARAAATELVRRPFPAGTWMAVVSIARDTRLVLGLTDDLGRLPGALEAATARSVERVVESPRDPDKRSLTGEAMGATLLATNDPVGVQGIDAAVAARMRAPSDHVETKLRETEARVATAIDTLNRERLGRTTLAALHQLAHALSGVGGRKTLLFFSEGLHVPEAVAGALDAAVSEANRANVAVYAFDPRGLRPESEDTQATKAALLAVQKLSEKAMRSRGDEEGSNRGVSPTEVRAHDLALDALRLDTQANLRDLAESTGGFLVANSNDLSAAIERVGADLRSYYEIGYEPANPIADGAFRRVQVKVARRGLTVRTRRGYFALPTGTASTLPDELPLAEALGQTSSPQELAFELKAIPGSVADGKAAVDLSVSVPLRSVTLVPEAGGVDQRARFAVLVLVRDAQGAIAARLSHDWPLTVPAAQAASVRERSATVRRSVDLAVGRYVIEAALQDRLSGAAGVSRIPLVVSP